MQDTGGRYQQPELLSQPMRVAAAYPILTLLTYGLAGWAIVIGLALAVAWAMHAFSLLAAPQL